MSRQVIRSQADVGAILTSLSVVFLPLFILPEFGYQAVSGDGVGGLAASFMFGVMPCALVALRLIRGRFEIRDGELWYCSGFGWRSAGDPSTISEVVIRTSVSSGGTMSGGLQLLVGQRAGVRMTASIMCGFGVATGKALAACLGVPFTGGAALDGLLPPPGVVLSGRAGWRWRPGKPIKEAHPWVIRPLMSGPVFGCLLIAIAVVLVAIGAGFESSSFG